MKSYSLVLFLLLFALPLQGYASPAIPELPPLLGAEEETEEIIPIVPPPTEPVSEEKVKEGTPPENAPIAEEQIIPVVVPEEESIKPIELPNPEESEKPSDISPPVEVMVPTLPIPDTPDSNSTETEDKLKDIAPVELPQVIEPEQPIEVITPIEAIETIPSTPDTSTESQDNATPTENSLPTPQTEQHLETPESIEEENNVENIETGKTLKDTNKPTESGNELELFHATTPSNTTSSSPSDNPVLSWQGSVMFNETEIKLLNDAINSFERGDAFVTPTINETTGEPIVAEAPATIEVPTFFLNSIMYFSKENWSVWLNGKKVSGITSENEPQVINITEKFAKFKWVTRSLDRFSPEWRNALTVKERSIFYSADRMVSFNEITGEINFTLKPNQSFSLDTMKISEGKPGNSSQNQSPQTPGSSPPENIPASTDDQLNNLYQKELDRINSLKQLPSAVQ